MIFLIINSFCFNGNVEFLYTMINYVDDHKSGQCSFYNTKYEKLPYRRSEYMEISKDLPKPKKF